MSNSKLNLPEPQLAEHTLIRDSAPIPELSAGFRSRVLSDCKTQIARSDRIQRWKVGGMATAACCLCLLISVAVTYSTETPGVVVEQPNTPSSPKPSDSLGLPVSSGQIAVDMPRPASVRDPEKSQMDQMMETLNKRQQLFDANMLGL